MIPVHRPAPAQIIECQPDDSAWRTVTRVLDLKTVAKLQSGLGGRDVKIPKRPKSLHEAHPLVAAIGREAAEALAQEIGGERIYVRTRHGGMDPHYDDIKAGIAEGLTNMQIADRLRLSERHLRKLRSMYGLTNPNQPPRITHRSVNAMIAAE